MRVWIDQELCTGAGECARNVPDVFWMGDDLLARVKEEAAHFDETVLLDPDLSAREGEPARARVPESLEAAVEDAAAQCPGACIFIEADPEPAPEPEPEPRVEPEPAPAPASESLWTRIKRRLRG